MSLLPGAERTQFRAEAFDRIDMLLYAAKAFGITKNFAWQYKPVIYPI